MVLPLYNSPFTHVPPRSCTLLPADAGGTFVNGPGKTNATFGVACFSFGLDYIIAPWFFGLDQVSKSDIV